MTIILVLALAGGGVVYHRISVQREAEAAELAARRDAEAKAARARKAAELEAARKAAEEAASVIDPELALPQEPSLQPDPVDPVDPQDAETLKWLKLKLN